MTESPRPARPDTHRIPESRMRFMIIGKAKKETEAGILPKPEAFDAMDS